MDRYRIVPTGWLYGDTVYKEWDVEVFCPGRFFGGTWVKRNHYASFQTEDQAEKYIDELLNTRAQNELDVHKATPPREYP
jgi:hypothetical protein